jgi:hypothetical protein
LGETILHKYLAAILVIFITTSLLTSVIINQLGFWENNSVEDNEEIMNQNPNFLHNKIPNMEEEDKNLDVPLEIENNENIELPVDLKNKKIDPQVLQNLNLIGGYFTENRGQVGNDSVRYYIHGAGVWFLDDGVVFEHKEEIKSDSPQSTVYSPESRLTTDDWRLMTENGMSESVEYRSVVIKLEFVKVNDVRPVGKDRLSWNNNYFYGNDSSKWCTGVPNFGEVWYENIYDNIDLRYYTNEKGLKYDFIVHPGGEPSDIIFRINGIEELYLNTDKNLIMRTKVGNIIDANLFIYQQFEGREKQIPGKFNILNNNEYNFEIIEEYNRNITLIIDPELVYSSYIGGSSHDYLSFIEIDSNNNIILSGQTQSNNFPITKGSYDSSFNGMSDIFIIKLNPNCSSLIFATYIGGKNSEKFGRFDQDSNENIIIAIETRSSDFPTSLGSYDTSFNGGNGDCAIVKLHKNGSKLLFSTFIGGKRHEIPYSVEIDSKENIYVTGSTSSSNFPITNGSFDCTYNDGLGSYDGYIVKLNSNGTKILNATFIGGLGLDYCFDIELDLTGNIYINGATTAKNFPTTIGAFDRTHNGYHDFFICKFDDKLSKPVYSTYLGGNQTDCESFIKLDSKGCIYLTGETASPNFPVTKGGYDQSHNGKDDAVILKLDQNGSKLIFSTFIGGADNERGCGIAFDYNNDILLTGYTSSKNFPTTFDAYDTTYNNGTYKGDGFLLMLSQNGSNLSYSTYIGGSNDDPLGFMVLSKDNRNLFITGWSNSSNFPTTKTAFDQTYNGNRDCILLIMKLSKVNSPPIINSFKATPALEGSKVIFTVNTIDPDNDSLTYSFDFQNDSIFDYVGKNNTVSFIWGDDHNGTATVKVSDGNLSTKANTSVIVYNVAPKLQVKVSLKNQSTDNILANLSVRIAGEKWHDVKIELFKNRTMVTNGALVRYPGSPNEQMLHFRNQTINSSSNWTAILRYTPDNDPVNGKPNGATPCWVILNQSNGKQIKMHHTFNVKHTDTHVWVVNLSAALPYNGNSSGRNATFSITVFDPGADDITLYLDFGDGINITRFYPNPNSTFPVRINATFTHVYSGKGPFTVTMIARDDDGGVTMQKITVY